MVLGVTNDFALRKSNGLYLKIKYKIRITNNKRII